MLNYILNTNYNQMVIMDYELDLVDLQLLDYLQMIENSIGYFEVKYQNIIDDLPIIKITSKRVIAERLDTLVKKGFLLKELKKEQGNKVYFKITQKIYCLMCS